jgi:integrase
VTVNIYSGHVGRYHTFTVYWRGAGRSHRKTFSHEKEAQKFAREQAESLAAGQVQSPAITATEVSTFREAERRLGDTAPIHVAAGEYASAVRRLGDAATLNLAVEFFLNNSIRSALQRSVSEVVEEFVAVKQSDGLSERYVEDVTWRRRGFAKDFKVNIEHVTTRNLDAWLRRLTTGLVTRDNFHKHIVTLFNFARRQGYLLRDRETEARWLEKPKIRSKPIEIFSPQKLSELLAAAEGQVKLAIVIGAFTGIRSAELLRLKWENFNWGEEVIDIGCDQTKTASRRLVPILPALVEWIKPHAKSHGPVLNYSLPVCLAEAFATTATKATKARGDRREKRRAKMPLFSTEWFHSRPGGNERISTRAD